MLVLKKRLSMRSSLVVLGAVRRRSVSAQRIKGWTGSNNKLKEFQLSSEQLFMSVFIAKQSALDSDTRNAFQLMI